MRKIKRIKLGDKINLEKNKRGGIKSESIFNTGQFEKINANIWFIQWDGFGYIW